MPERSNIIIFKRLSIEQRIVSATFAVIVLVGIAIIVGESGTSDYELAVLNLGPFAIHVPWLRWDHWHISEGYLGLIAAFILFLSSQVFGARARLRIAGALSAVTLVSGIVAIGFVPAIRPQAHDIRDQMLYYLGAKYYDEIGYEALTGCIIQAARENGVRPPPRFRDQSTNAILDTARYLASAPACRDRFSPEKWGAFSRDVLVFASGITKWTPYQWELTLSDHGFNGSPVLRRIISTTAVVFPATHRGLSLYGLLNLFAVFIALYAILFRVGWREALVTALLMFVYSGDGLVFLMSIPRYFWLSAILTGVALLYRGGRVAVPLAGALLILSAGIKVFPGAWLVGPSLLAAGEIRRNRSLKGGGARLLMGAAAAAVILFVWTIADAHHLANWTEFIDRMRLNANRATTGCVGFFFNFVRPLPEPNGHLGPMVMAMRNPLLGPVTMLHVVRALQVLLTIAVLRASWRLGLPRAAMLTGFGLMFLWTKPMGYYYAGFLGLPLLFPYGQDRNAFLFASLWLVLTAAVTKMVCHRVDSAVLYTLIISSSLTVFLLGALCRLEIEYRRGRTKSRQSEPSAEPRAPEHEK